MHVRLMFPNEYLCAADLRGKDVTLTIREVKQEELRSQDGGTEPKWILYFDEMKGRGKDEKRLVLNKTNAVTIAKLHGSDSEGWKGKKIVVHPAMVKSFGEMVEAIRIRKQAPK